MAAAFLAQEAWRPEDRQESYPVTLCGGRLLGVVCELSCRDQDAISNPVSRESLAEPTAYARRTWGRGIRS